MTPLSVLQWIDQFSDFYWIPAIVISYLFCFAGYKVLRPAITLSFFVTGASVGWAWAPNSGQPFDPAWMDLLLFGAIGVVLNFLVLMLQFVLIILGTAILGGVLACLLVFLAIQWLGLSNPDAGALYAIAFTLGAFGGFAVAGWGIRAAIVTGTASLGATGLVSWTVHGLELVGISFSDALPSVEPSLILFVVWFLLAFLGRRTQYKRIELEGHSIL